MRLPSFPSANRCRSTAQLKGTRSRVTIERSTETSRMLIGSNRTINVDTSEVGRCFLSGVAASLIFVTWANDRWHSKGAMRAANASVCLVRYNPSLVLYHFVLNRRMH